MSSINSPRIVTFKADGAIAKGKAVKIGTDREHVVVAAGNTDPCIGIAQNAAVNADDLVEVALQGGGAKGLAKESITAGKSLVSNADGSLEQTNASGDKIIGVALEDASAGDIFAVEVCYGFALAADK